MTLTVMSAVLNRTPRKTMEVEGGLSLSGEDEVKEQLVKGLECRVRIGGDLCTSKIVDVVRAIEAQRAEHKGDCGCSALAHHRGRA